MVQKSMDMREKAALNAELERKKAKVTGDLTAATHTKEMEAIRKKEYLEMKKASEIKKIKDRENLKSHDHIENKNYDGMFAGIKKFFVGLFGS